MKKITTLFILITVSFLSVNCKTNENKQDFSLLAKNYFDDKNALNPLDATQYGQNEYNAQLEFEMTDSYRKKQADFFDKYEQVLATTEESQLSEEEKNSYEIIKWEIEVGKELLKYPTNLMPISQIDERLCQFLEKTGSIFYLDRFGNGVYEKRDGKRSCFAKSIDAKSHSAIC